jgi:hypothetical protein
LGFAGRCSFFGRASRAERCLAAFFFVMPSPL